LSTKATCGAIPETKTPQHAQKEVHDGSKGLPRNHQTSLARWLRRSCRWSSAADHSLGAGSVFGRGDLGPHDPQAADRTPGGRRPRRHEHANSSTSGNVHGSAARGAARSRASAESASRAPAASTRRCCPSTTVLIGIRNLDDREKELGPLCRDYEGHRIARGRS
jgi:hypothetical protein